ncbi:ParB N-terminal domain-containing protein [Sphingomonas sp. LY29]|uniref:ParB N-terminal domain-containing protein n=1 Tax=Sphingomonas sp. LY29 TaxID=3095341 RepID=UPI002D78E149|nr:ParB N-terminal domain-containing protein [Sphingomonas sp. LY29]WRP25272.1 ParB N-terminal domain-containing protein [Sphingomonas sp. LY29]
MSKSDEGILWRYKSVGLRALNVDQRFQMRADGLDEQRVKKYAFDMRRGDGFPAITVASIDGRLNVLDGFHRVEAALRAELPDINAKIAKLTEKAAVREAIKANARHGLNLNRKDKRNIFRLYLERGDHLRRDGEPKSLRQMAADLHHLVSHGTVRNWLKAEGITPTEDPDGPLPFPEQDRRFISPGLDEFNEALGYTEELFLQLESGDQTEAMYGLLGVADRLANGETRWMDAIARSNLPLDVAKKLEI